MPPTLTPTLRAADAATDPMPGVRPVVAHHPARHPYIEHAVACSDRATDIDVFDVERLRQREVTVVHVHFGFEHLTVGELSEWVDALDEAGIALVHTVHDLDNPHLVGQADFHALVEVLVRRSAAVLTLTPAAAAVIRDRHGVDAHVVRHPHIVARSVLEAWSCERSGFERRHPRRGGLYVHASMVRPNLDIDLLGRFAAVAHAVGGMVVHVRDSVGAADLERLRAALDHPGVVLDVEPRLTDDTLWHRIADADVLLLPYRWGTHSGLLETARDLGVPVLAPTIGGFGDQGAHLIDDTDLIGSITAAMHVGRRVTPADRIREADRLTAFHTDLYSSVTAERHVGRVARR